MAAAFAGCAAPAAPAVSANDAALSQDLSTTVDAASPIDFSLPPPSDLMPACADLGACSTGNPGMCASGHLACTTTCTPDVTTQPCYSGPPATAGAGICKAGTQSCIGTLGACVGQVLPALVENCFNDLDDDCDGVVNNGCPIAITLGTARTLAPQGNPTGGGAFPPALCPAGAFLIHQRAYLDAGQKTVQGAYLYCAQPQLTRGATSYSLSTTLVMPSPYIMLLGGDPNPAATADIDCTVAGALTAGWTTLGYANPSLYSLGLACATATATLDGTNKLTITMAANGNQGDPGYTTGTMFSESCAPNEVLIGYQGRKGNWMDQVIPVCAPFQVTYK